MLLLDEPLGALDLKLRRQMQLELKRIQTEVGITFVHVTHDQEEAMTMADTVAVMNGGRVEQLGAPAELYENPRTTFVANFLGTSNLIEAEVAAVERRRTAAEGRRAPTACGCPRSAVPPTTRTGGKVLVGVRPRRSPSRTPTTRAPIPEGRNRLTGTIADSSFIGVSTQYVVDSPVCPEFEVYEQNIERDARLVPGAEVVLHWNPAHTFGLDAAQDIDAGVETARGEPPVTATEARPAPERRPGDRLLRDGKTVRSARRLVAVLAAAARHPLAARLLRAADGLPGVHLRADAAPWRRASRSPGTSRPTGTR